MNHTGWIRRNSTPGVAEAPDWQLYAMRLERMSMHRERKLQRLAGVMLVYGVAVGFGLAWLVMR